ncbi:MAG: hypothetical protein IPK83_18795 [Planctomycetes bacterium]|nr:hypothetical protein [Planctomycetota bacterium]
MDFSAESIERVEHVLSKLHLQRLNGKMTDHELSTLSARYGAYIGEVIRKLKGGHWESDHPAAGPASYPLHWSDHQSFPLGWCYKRIVTGEEDNVYHKFVLIVLEVQESSEFNPQPP